MRRIRQRRWPSSGDDRGTMALLMMVMIVGLALSALLVPMIITADRTTRFDTTRVQALDAAQAGINVTIGLIRGAVTPDASIPPVSIGDSGKLPCGPLSGAVNSTSASAYTVSVQYFTADPTTILAPAAMKCSPGYGTYDSGSGVVTPSFARITSTGTVGTAVNGSTGGRTLTTTYVFKTSNTNIAGGVIRIFSTSTSMCMDVGSASPVVSTGVVLQPCSSSTPPIAQQVFAYRTDLTIQLVSSVSAASPNGLCLNSSAAPAASGNSMILSPCGPLGSPSPYTEQWSFNDWGSFQAAQDTSSNDGVLANLCMNVSAQTAGLPVTLVACDSNSTSDPNQAWIPAPSVGAGAAAAPPPMSSAATPRQWINYNEFGRCLDITGTVVKTNHLIDYPCKQNPHPTSVAWNQLFLAPALASQVSVTGLISTNDTSDNIKACLTSPGTNGGYVTMGQPANGVMDCGTGLPSQNWTIYGGDSSLPYSSKYRIIDSTGLCLGLTTPVSGEAWSVIDVETCSGATDQKWNANPDVLSASLKNTTEK